MTHAILIVEDDIHGQQITKALLEHSGFLVDAAANADQALELLHRTPYHAAIIDLSLPDVSGWDLLETILQTPPSPLCIAITAYHSAKVARQALEAGFTAYFPKPIEMDTFATQIKRILAETGT